MIPHIDPSIAAHPSEAMVETGMFGHLPDGRSVRWFRLRQIDGSSFTICEYGGVLLSIQVPDRDGSVGDIILGYKTLDEYIEDPYYFGVIVGRFANRIGGGRFPFHGDEIVLAQNQGENHHHGGVEGFGKKVWTGSVVETTDGPAIRLELQSPDSEEGYPGNLDVRATYSMPRPGEIRVQLEATTDHATIVNLTLHPYFNLSGHNSSILEHELLITTDQFLELRPDSVPTGEILPVHSTPMDFRSSKPIGADIGKDFEQLRYACGYDHCWVWSSDYLKKMAHVSDPASGRWLEVHSTAPGLQFYTGNFLGNSGGVNGNRELQPRDAFCLEPQGLPDAPNHPDFPSVELQPGERYSHRIVYRFGTTA